jgi:DNA-directed RNA polymerase subunit RPC12/RpoP
MKRDLDRWLTKEPERRDTMIPVNTEVTCPACDTEFVTKADIQEDATVNCENCDTKLILVDGDLEEFDESEDITEGDDEDEDEDDSEGKVPIA